MSKGIVKVTTNSEQYIGGHRRQVPDTGSVSIHFFWDTSPLHFCLPAPFSLPFTSSYGTWRCVSSKSFNFLLPFFVTKYIGCILHKTRLRLCMVIRKVRTAHISKLSLWTYDLFKKLTFSAKRFNSKGTFNSCKIEVLAFILILPCPLSLCF